MAEGAGLVGAANGALGPGDPAPGPALAPAGVPAPASQFTVLVMRPCGGQDEAAAADGISRPAAPALGGSSSRDPKSAGYQGELGDGEEETGEDEGDLLDTSDPPGGGESAASLEDLEDEETHSGGEGAGGGSAPGQGSPGSCVSKTCTYEGCSETTSQVAKQRKPWMCKKHRNKMYKDKYKKKKSDQAQNGSGTAPSSSSGNVKLEVGREVLGRRSGR